MNPTQEFISDLRRHVAEVAFDHLTRVLFSTDASVYQVMPVGVAWPRNTEEVIAAVETAAQHNVPVLPRGGGSSLAGQAIGQALILDFSRYMDTILEINPEARTVRVQPGVLLGHLNRTLKPYGLKYGPDPASGDRATMGGIIGNNATGAHSLAYGLSHNHLLSAETVLSDGSPVKFQEADPQTWKTRGARSGLEGAIYQAIPTILSDYAPPIATRYPNTFRTVAGYNLNVLAQQTNPNPASLLAGSEGTLGIITAATLNLVPRPSQIYLYLVHFQNMRAALEAVPTILETDPYAVELIGKMLIDLARSKPTYRKLLTAIQGEPEAVLAVEYSGTSKQELAEKQEQLTPFGQVVPLPDPAEQDKIWKARKVGLGIIQSTRGDNKPTTIIEDAAVPVEHLADYALEIRRFAKELGVERTALYAHASAGCLHIRPMVSLKDPEGLRQMRLLAEKSLELVQQYGGTTSGEHGEGMLRAEFSERLFGPELTEAFHRVKQAFDPQNLLNPGKIVHPPRMDDESLMRYGTDYHTPHAPQETVFSFQEDHGFDGAVEMCNGAGVCRKLDEGVMCPSFMATRDEKHSTRGRANALRAALTGRLGPEGLTSQELYEVLDLCLSCQACQSECPSTVDMSKLKAEFLHHYYREHGVPLRSWVFANIETLNKLAAPFPRLANAVLSGPGRVLFNALGIHPERQMPAFAAQRFTTWFKHRKSALPVSSKKKVVFFHDTYMEHNHPHIGQAAVEVLEKMGYQPLVLDKKVDSGRPAVSKGLLPKARRLAEKNIALLAPYAEQGLPIVGCEPSSVVMLVKEYRSLVPGPESDRVAEAAFCLEDFLIEEARIETMDLAFDQRPRHVLFHGHCQQKANFGTENTRKLLELIPNCTVEDSESTCCGMAGAFGYEKEHYDLSIQIAELGLAPKVRAAAPETIICATGTSCREQIGDTTSRNALHPIEVFAQALA